MAAPPSEPAPPSPGGGRDPPRARPAEDSITRDLVRAARDGDEATFAALYERLAPSLYGWAVLRIPDELAGWVEPDDLLQDVWVRALGAFARYDPERGPFRPWLFGVAKHVLLDALRRHRVRVRPSQEPARDEGGEGGSRARLSQVPGEGTAISRRIARREDVATFLAEVAALAEPDRDLLVHHGLEGLTLEQTGRRLGIGRDAAHKRWQRLRRRLRERSWPEGMIG